MPILDCHTHAFPDTLAPAAMKVLTSDWKWEPVRAFLNGTVADLLASMDRAGITHTILCSIATRPSQVPRITDWSASIASDRIFPFASIHPDFPEPEAEVRRIASLGLRGIKFHPQYMWCPIDDPRCLRICRAAADADLAVTVHGGYDLSFDHDDFASPQRLRNLHDQVPNLRLLACHLGGWQCWEGTLAHLIGRPVYLETSYCFSHCPAPLLEQMITRHPPEYLLFGTDSPWADQADELARFRKLPRSPAAVEGALWDNALRFLGNS